MLLLVNCSLFVLITLATAAQWDYKSNSDYGPEKWKDHYPACGGKSQSPVAFWKEDVKVKSDLAELKMDQYLNSIGPKKLRLHNNGHSLQVDVPDDVEIQISGGNLPDWYRLVQFHFHWGESDSEGAEHYVGDTVYPLILHLVHVRQGKRLEHNWDDQDDLAVIAVGFHLSENNNTELAKIVNHLREVSFKSEENPIDETMVIMNLVPSNYSNFFRYHGSLTTPPCWESVIWTVLVDTVDVSKSQLNIFRELFSTARSPDLPEHMRGNFRPIQPLNDRTVTVRYPVNDLPPRPLTQKASIVECPKSAFAGILTFLTLVLQIMLQFNDS